VLLDTVPYQGSPRDVAQALREIYDEILAGAAAGADAEPAG